MDAVVEAGEYASASKVIRDTLRQWRERRNNFGYTRDELRRLGTEGADSGPARYASIDEIKAEARRRLEAERLAS